MKQKLSNTPPSALPEKTAQQLFKELLQHQHRIRRGVHEIFLTRHQTWVSADSVGICRGEGETGLDLLDNLFVDPDDPTFMLHWDCGANKRRRMIPTQDLKPKDSKQITHQERTPRYDLLTTISFWATEKIIIPIAEKLEKLFEAKPQPKNNGLTAERQVQTRKDSKK